MKKILFVSLFTLLFAFSVNVSAAEKGWYMSGNLGVAMADDSNLGTLGEADLEYITELDWPSGTTASIDLEYDMGIVLGAAVGYDFGDYRIESELAYQANDMDKGTMRVTVPGEGSESDSAPMSGDVSSFTILINGYYDFFKDSVLRPYITAGIGYSFVDIEIESESDDDSVFAYQVGAGITYEMNENITWDLRYRYFDTSDPLDLEYSSHSVTAGLRYYF